MRKLAVIFWFAASAAALAAGEYKFLKQVPIGGAASWDYLTIDASARRLYVTNGNRIVVLDLNTDSVIGEIADTPGVHGFALALPYGFSSNGKENKVSVVDLKTLRTIKKVTTGENPDAILYDPARAEVYVFNGRGRSATVLDAKNANVVATIPLDGKPEFAVADPENGRVFSNIEDKSEVVAIETKSHTVVAHWPLAPGEEPTGLAFDNAHHRSSPGAATSSSSCSTATTARYFRRRLSARGWTAVLLTMGGKLFLPRAVRGV